jgi:hypothetical protein
VPCDNTTGDCVNPCLGDANAAVGYDFKDPESHLQDSRERAGQLIGADASGCECERDFAPALCVRNQEERSTLASLPAPDAVVLSSLVGGQVIRRGSALDATSARATNVLQSACGRC